MALLTLDLATRIGWTCGRPDDTQFASGTHTLTKTGKDIGEFLRAFEEWFEAATDDVTVVVFESPILPRTTSLATCRKLYGLAGALELFCLRYGIDCWRSRMPRSRRSWASSGCRVMMLRN